MIQYLLQATVLMAIFYVPFTLLYRNETFFRYNRLYLLVSIVVALLAPLSPQWITISEAPAAMVYLETLTVGSDIVVTPAVVEQTGARMDVADVMLIVYAVVAIFFLIRIGVGVAQIVRMYQRGSKERIQGLLVVTDHSVAEPFSFFGWIFLPHDVRYSKEQFDPVFEHESRHVRSMHSVDTVMVEILCALFWINPLIYVYRRALKTVHEYEADNFIEDDNIIEYSQLLISRSQSGLRLALTNQFFQSQLKSRIMMMMKQRSNTINKWKYLLAAPVLVLSLALFSFKTSPGSSVVNSTSVTVTVGEVDEMPRFPGCEEASDKQMCSNKKLIAYIVDNMQYPADAKNAGIEGKVFVKFTVESDGSISDVKAVKGVGYGCDDEAVRVVRSMNKMDEKWVPGIKDGKAVAVEMTLPFTFALPAEGSQGEVFKTVDEMPRFPGCEHVELMDQRSQCAQTKMIEYVFQNLKYPADAKDKKIEGRVIAQFVVEPNGLVSAVKVVKGLYPSCDAEVIRVLETMNEMDQKWVPGKQDGKAVKVQYTLPVQFAL